MELNEHGTMGGRASENTRTSYYAHTQTNGVDPTKLFVSLTCKSTSPVRGQTKDWHEKITIE